MWGEGRGVRSVCDGGEKHDVVRLLVVHRMHAPPLTQRLPDLRTRQTHSLANLFAGCAGRRVGGSRVARVAGTTDGTPGAWAFRRPAILQMPQKDVPVPVDVRVEEDAGTLVRAQNGGPVIRTAK